MLPPRAWEAPCLAAPGWGGVCIRGRASTPSPWVGPGPPPPRTPLGFHPERASSGRSEAMELPAPIKIPTASKGGSGGCAAQHPPPPSPPSTQPCPGEPPHPHVCSSTGCHTNPPPPQPLKSCCEERGRQRRKEHFSGFCTLLAWRWWEKSKERFRFQMLPWCKPQGLAGAPEGGGRTRNHTQLGFIFGLWGLQDSAPPGSELRGLGGAIEEHGLMCPQCCWSPQSWSSRGGHGPQVPPRGLNMKPSTQAAPLASGSGVDLHV